MMLISSVAPIVKTIEKFSTVLPTHFKRQNNIAIILPKFRNLWEDKVTPTKTKSETAFYIVVSYVEFVEIVIEFSSNLTMKLRDNISKIGEQLHSVGK